MMMNKHMHIKPKMTLRNWLRENPNTKSILAAFDTECEEITCECIHQEYLQNGELFMNVKTHQVFLGNKEIKLTPKTFKILEYILRRKGQCVTYKEILTNLWGAQHSDALHYIRVFVRELRMALGESGHSIVKTVSKVGLIIDEVKEA